jgi:hypothetical protein
MLRVVAGLGFGGRTDELDVRIGAATDRREQARNVVEVVGQRFWNLLLSSVSVPSFWNEMPTCDKLVSDEPCKPVIEARQFAPDRGLQVAQRGVAQQRAAGLGVRVIRAERGDLRVEVVVRLDEAVDRGGQ